MTIKNLNFIKFIIFSPLLASTLLQPLDPCTIYQLHDPSPDRIQNKSVFIFTDLDTAFLKSFGSVSKKLKKNTLEDIFNDIFAKLCNFNTRIRIRIRSTDPYPEHATQMKTDTSGPAFRIRNPDWK